MLAPGSARALARAMTIALAALMAPEALAEPIASTPAKGAPTLSPDRRLELDAMRHPDPIRLAAIDPKTPNPIETESAGTEPFGLTALQAPEGGLWRKCAAFSTKSG